MVLTFIEEIATAKEAWETLCQTFQASSVSAKIFIKKEFYNTKLGENDDIDQHIHKSCRLSKDLKIAGFSIPESEFISVVLMSLPSSWDSFISSIDGEDLESSDTAVSKKAAKSILGHFQTKAMHRKSQNSSSSPAAFNFQKNVHYSKSRPNKLSTECMYCHKKGHWIRECRKHISDEKKKNAHVTTQKGKGDLASVFNGSNSDYGDAWISNTGAEFHIICDHHSFTEYTPLSDEYIKGMGGIKT